MSDNSTSSSSSHRLRHRMAIVDSEVPNFYGIKNGIYISDVQGKNGNVMYFDDGYLKTKTKNGPELIIPTKKFTIDPENKGIIIGSVTRCQQSVGTVIIGDQSGESLLFGSDNLFFGRNVGGRIQEGNNLIAIGANSLGNSSAVGDSIAIGVGSMSDCGKTEMNIGIGKDSLSKINDSYNIALGIEAGKEMKGPLINHNILIGREVMKCAQESTINLIAIGSQAASNIRGNNFQSIYIGDKVANNLNSSVISVNNIGIGSQTLINASNISDCVCIGPGNSQHITGVRSIILGSGTANRTIGSLEEEIIIGSFAGSDRNYGDAGSPVSSHNLFIGSYAGQTGEGGNNIGMGSYALSDSNSSYCVSIGDQAGKHSTAINGINIGRESGISSSGDNNIFMGQKTGNNLIGSNNVWIGNVSQISDTLDDCVIIGSDIMVKGKKGIVMGCGAGSSSVGYLYKDILIGDQAGVGQKYNEENTQYMVNNKESSRNLVFIGSCAGMGDKENPENIDSKETICIGHDAGRSDEQAFDKSVILGNYAGSFAAEAVESVIIGHGAGVNTSGKKNIYLGAHSGVNIKGSGNIIFGEYTPVSPNDMLMNSTLIIGNKERPTLIGDLERGNLLVGSSYENTKNWIDGEGALGFTDVQKPKILTDNNGALYSCKGHLEYTTSTRSCNLTFPYKFIHQGNITGLSFLVDTSIDGSTLLIIKLVPANKPEYLLSTEMLLTVKDKQISITNCIVGKWILEIKFNDSGSYVVFKCDNIVEGIAYIEAIGEHIIKKL